MGRFGQMVAPVEVDYLVPLHRHSLGLLQIEQRNTGKSSVPWSLCSPCFFRGIVFQECLIVFNRSLIATDCCWRSKYPFYSFETVYMYSVHCTHTIEKIIAHNISKLKTDFEDIFICVNRICVIKFEKNVLFNQ